MVQISCLIVVGAPIFFLQLCCVCSESAIFHDPLEIWISTLRASETRTLLGVQQHSSGRVYTRGFAKSSFGTILFPVVIHSEESATEGADFTKGLLANIYIRGRSAQESYSKFLEYMSSYFCKTNDGEHWACCDQSFLTASCEDVPQKAKDVMSLIVDPIQSITLIFLYHWCVEAWHDYRSQPNISTWQELEKYCPNPCHGNPCLALLGIDDPLACKMFGAYEDEYRCDCDDMHVWNPQRTVCEPKNPCLNKKFPPCVVENTVRCVSTGRNHVRCICKEQFMGFDCSLLRDACLERLNQSMPSGNTRCQIQNGNQCHPILGTDSYSCTCITNYLSLSVSEDNCLGQRDPCKIRHSGTKFEYRRTNPATDYDLANLKIDCLNGGECVASGDFTRSACVCPQSPSGELLFQGQVCEFAVGVWSGWSTPSLCLPQRCGHTRYRWRRRKCLNGTGPQHLIGAGSRSVGLKYQQKQHVQFVLPCTGASEEVLPCEELPHCLSVRLPSRIREEILHYESLYLFCYVTLAEIIFSILSWFVFGEPLVKFFYRRNVRFVNQGP
ncbi:hypothetical protein CRM22_001621 [Opisthorchis felineus]|uniref:EGF-like domain-containing protein n=1 Tax=Opisthorchis felineus TaxID=147828 RepID=A0A4S2MG87_OPIFE|nr:hypothetical protein CRM22_001621 [Opisthorchis felineus]